MNNISRRVLAPLSELSQTCGICLAERPDIRCSSCHPTRNDDQVTGAVYCTWTCRLAHAASHGAICEETRHPSRLALLFQILFVQYLLWVTSGTKFFVSEDDGVFKCFFHTKILSFDNTTRSDANAIAGYEAGDVIPGD